MDRYDAIIMGGGISGLGVAALLSKDGYKTLLLERESILGGRSASFDYRGYVIDIGLHTVASYSSSGIFELIESVGAELELAPIKPSLMHYDLDSRRFMRATSQERFGENLHLDFRKLVNVVTVMRREEMNGLHNISAQQWILGHFGNPDLVEFFKQITGFAGQPMDEVSAGAFLETLNDAFTSQHTIMYPESGGIQALPNALGEAVERHGGTIITGIHVGRILIEGRRAVGVQAKIIRPSMISEFSLYAPIVVYTIPLKLLTHYIPKELCGTDMLEKIARIKTRDYYYIGLIAGVEASLLDDFSGQFFQWTVDRKGMDWHAIVTIPTWADPKLAPENRHLLYIDSHGPAPFADMSFARKRQQELMQILDEIWPGFGEKTDWIQRVVYPNVLPLAQTELTGPYRPGHKLPELEGLYLAGDATYLSGSGLGSAVKSAFGCVREIEDR